MSSLTQPPKTINIARFPKSCIKQNVMIYISYFILIPLKKQVKCNMFWPHCYVLNIHLMEMACVSLSTTDSKVLITLKKHLFGTFPR